MIRRGAPAGMTTLTVVALMALERFLVEFVRAKDDHLFGGMTLAQFISLGVLVVFSTLILFRRPRMTSS